MLKTKKISHGAWSIVVAKKLTTPKAQIGTQEFPSKIKEEGIRQLEKSKKAPQCICNQLLTEEEVN